MVRSRDHAMNTIDEFLEAWTGPRRIESPSGVNYATLRSDDTDPMTMHRSLSKACCDAASGTRGGRVECF